MKKINVVFYDVSETDEEQLRSHLNSDQYDVTLIHEPISLDNVVEAADVISVFVSSAVGADIIDRLPNLKLIACRSTGFNNIDLDSAFSKKIAVVNVPSYGSNTVAEYTFALLLGLSRKLVEVINYTKQGKLEHEQFRGFDLVGKTLGIIGTGKIGLKVAEIAKGFGMHIRGYDPYPNQDQARELGINYSSLTELVEYSDFISLHAPYSEANHHLINESLLNKCKHGVILINTARGELVDTRALLDALQSGRVAGAGLDVLEDEQLLDLEEEMLLLRAHTVDATKLQHSLEIKQLQRMSNVIITKHNAFNTFEAVSRINETTIENIENFFHGTTSNTVGAKTGSLVIVRHSESEWNAMGKWTGVTDVHLTTKGVDDSAMMGEVLKDINFDRVFVSEQVRTHETAVALLKAAGKDHELETASGLNERDYGIYTGKNKWEVKEEVGEEEFQSIRRGWNHPIEGGESLKQVYDRALPFFKDTIVPLVTSGKNVLIVAHGNSIRSLVKYIESLSDEEIESTEMIFGTALIYTLNKDGTMINKQLRTIDSVPPPA